MKNIRWNQILILLAILVLVVVLSNKSLNTSTKSLPMEIIEDSILLHLDPNATIYKYRINKEIKNKSDFAEFLELRDKSNIKKLDITGFKHLTGSMTRESLMNKISVKNKLFKTYYIFEYSVPFSNICTIEVSSDGYVTDRLSVGK